MEFTIEDLCRHLKTRPFMVYRALDAAGVGIRWERYEVDGEWKSRPKPLTEAEAKAAMMAFHSLKVRTRRRA